MRSLKATINRAYVVNMVCVAICLCPLFLSYWTSSRASNNLRTSFKVANRTSKLTVVPTKLLDDKVLELTVRNDYTEMVTSYAYSFDLSSGYHTEENAMRPGETSTSPLALPEQTTSDEAPVLTILAVAFQDNTGDGDLRIVRDLIDMQLGEAVQIERINGLVRDFSLEITQDLPARLAKLKSDIAKLPDPPEAETSFSFRAAVHDETKGALEKVEELERAYLEKGLEGFQLRLNKVQAGYERRNSSYRSRLARQPSK